MAYATSCTFHLRPTEQPRSLSLANSSKLLSIHHVSQNSSICSKRILSLITKAEKIDRNKKPNSVICGDCDGNGAVECSQCKGSGVNSVDVFNGRFKAGAACWLCGGKKDILCGNCNGAGFIGGFMSTYDE
ncbi:hypothetical protein ACFE04_014930 [Oxalis oulophora]